MELKCEFKHQNWNIGSTTIDFYTCEVNNPQIIAPRTIVRAFDGIHLIDRSDKDVEAINFYYGNMQHLPRGMSKIFPHLRVLSVYKCGLLKIYRADLRGFQLLETLWLQSNKLKYLPSDLLVGMSRLKRVSFTGNQIESLSSQILKPLINNGMEWIDFRSNKNINAFYYHTGADGSHSTIEDLMKIIDTQCTKPNEDLMENDNEDSTIETFNAKAMRVFSDLWDSKKYSDFKIIAGEKEFRVHKFVLEAHSLKFAAMFNDKEKEAKEMKIKDLDIEVVETFLRYLYTGKISGSVDAMGLFALSSKLEVPELTAFCTEMVLEKLQESNALKIFNLGHTYDCEEFKKEAFYELRRALPDFNLTDEMMEKPESLKELVAAKQLYESMKTKFKKM